MELRHRIDVLANQQVTNELFETAMEFVPVTTVWAAVVPQTGSLQRQQPNTVLTNVTHKVIVRYSSGKFITKDMKIRYKNSEFTIKFILNPYFSNEFLEIFCEEVLV